MKRPNFIITVPEPCSQNWEQMTPDGCHRFCTSCQKTIIDFSSFTDQELSQFLSKNTGEVCGRFHNSQLDRELMQPVVADRGFGSWGRRIAASLLLFNAMLSSATARPARTKPRHEVAPADKLPVATTHMITGRLINHETGQPMEGIKICLSGVWKTTVTGADGSFQLPVPKYRKNRVGVLYILFPKAVDHGHGNNTVPITLDSNYNSTVTLYRTFRNVSTVEPKLPKPSMTTEVSLGKLVYHHRRNEPYYAQKAIWNVLSWPFRTRK